MNLERKYNLLMKQYEVLERKNRENEALCADLKRENKRLDEELQQFRSRASEVDELIARLNEQIEMAKGYRAGYKNALNEIRTLKSSYASQMKSFMKQING